MCRPGFSAGDVPAISAGKEIMPRPAKFKLQPPSTTTEGQLLASVPSEGRCILMIESSDLRDDGFGGIFEVPRLLKIVENLRGRMDRLLHKMATVHEVVAYVGRYEFEVSADRDQDDLLFGRNLRELILPPLSHAVKMIEENAKSAIPKTSAELGLSPDIVQVEIALSEILKFGTSTKLRDHGSDESTQLPTVSLDALSAIAREAPRRQRIDGVLTGLGLEPGGVRIEINKRVRPAIFGMTLEMTIPYLQRPTQVVGFLTYKDDQSILEEYIFSDCPEASSFRF